MCLFLEGWPIHPDQDNINDRAGNKLGTIAEKKAGPPASHSLPLNKRNMDSLGNRIAKNLLVY